MSRYLSLVQSDKYSVFTIWQYLYSSIKTKRYMYIYVLVYFVMFLLFKCSVILAVLFEMFTLLYMINDSVNIYTQAKYTHRYIRLMIVSICVYAVLLILVVRYYTIVSIFLVSTVVYMVGYISITLALIMLSPIEYMIGLSYIYRAKKKMQKLSYVKVIGITGSYAKTSVKNILYRMLSTRYRVVMSPLNYNTPFGITKTILDYVDDSVDILILEMGIDRVGDMHKLLSLVTPHYAILTNIGRQHMKSMGSIENICKEKYALIDSVSSMGGVTITNNYNSIICRYLHKCNHTLLKSSKIYKCGRYCKSISFTLSNYVYDGSSYYSYSAFKGDTTGSSFDLSIDGRVVCSMSTHLVGEYNVVNILLAIAMSVKLGVGIKDIVTSLDGLYSIDSRMQISVKASGGVVINKGYNSNIDSCKDTLKVLRLYNGKKIIVITPGLIECGEHMYEYNYTFGKYLSDVVSLVYIVGSINKNAITDGLINNGFDKANICYLSTRDEWVDIVNNISQDEVILFENDVVEKYRGVV